MELVIVMEPAIFMRAKDFFTRKFSSAGDISGRGILYIVAGTLELTRESVAPSSSSSTLLVLYRLWCSVLDKNVLTAFLSNQNDPGNKHAWRSLRQWPRGVHDCGWVGICLFLGLNQAKERYQRWQLRSLNSVVFTIQEVSIYQFILTNRYMEILQSSQNIL